MNEVGAAIRILAVDDHVLIREGITRLLERESDMQLVAEASNGRDAVRLFRSHLPDITLMDMQMPEMNGLDAIITLRKEFPNTRVIVLTTYPGDVLALRALQAGAQAYLLKTALSAELRQTIRAVMAGRKFLSPEISYQLAEHSTDDALTSTEVCVLQLIAAGNANKEIASHLSVSSETIKGQVSRILSKLAAKDRTHAVVIGLQRGIIAM